MRFGVSFYRSGSYGIAILPSATRINYQYMDAKHGEWKPGEEECFESLGAAKKNIRQSIKDDRLSTSERQHAIWGLNEITLESLVDDELEYGEGEHKKLKALQGRIVLIADPANTDKFLDRYGRGRIVDEYLKGLEA
jgi:hypothetical protein